MSRARRPSPDPDRRRRGGRVAAVVAVTVLWLITGVAPVVQYAVARHVPAGADVRDAVVTGFEQGPAETRRNRGLAGEIVDVDVADGTSGTIYLDYRWDSPEVGDRVRVYGTAPDLESPLRASWLLLVGGLVLLVLYPTITLGWLRSRRRAEQRRAESERWEQRHVEEGRRPDGGTIGP